MVMLHYPSWFHSIRALGDQPSQNKETTAVKAAGVRLLWLSVRFVLFGDYVTLFFFFLTVLFLSISNFRLSLLSCAPIQNLQLVPHVMVISGGKSIPLEY